MTSVATTEAAPARVTGAAPWVFVFAVFASAALVFLAEPMIARMVLPALGGSPAIWNTSLAFFQVALLTGYGYAHVLQRLGSVRMQMAVHVAVLALAALVLPLRVSDLLGAPWEQAPALWLAATLALSIGPPFAVLSATAPLLQAWAARLYPTPPGGRDAYALYAASNLGSLLALAAYPMLVEPLLGLHAQALWWSLAYGGFALLLAALAVTARHAPPSPVADAEPIEAAPPSTWRQRLTWMLLAAAPASLLAGVTAHITADVASAPFLWVIPLELYLLTFVIAFVGKARVPPTWLLLLQLIAVAGALVLVSDLDTPWPEQLAGQLSAFFLTAMLCHQTLAARRPPVGRLTEFYLWMSLGGVLGGSFNAFIAPVIFDEVWEYPIVLVLACLARPTGGRPLTIWQTGFLAAGLVWPIPLLIPRLPIPDEVRSALLLVPAVMALMLHQRRLAVVGLLAMIALASEVNGMGRYREHHRSFFGVAHITEQSTEALGTIRTMVHGTTLHGAQALSEEKECQPTTYYAPHALIGQVFATEQARRPGMRIAAVGLGAGTVAAFVRPTDSMRFFEIDPVVGRIAFDPSKFSFVKGCAKGPVDLVLGDARVSLTREPASSYDLMLVDAFSSDSVPTHLLTTEALRLYLSRLKPDGVLVLHLSNRNLALSGPAAATAKAAGATARVGMHWTTAETVYYVEASGVALLVARNPAALEAYNGLTDWTPPQTHSRPWTDDYTNVWGAMIDHFRSLY